MFTYADMNKSHFSKWSKKKNVIFLEILIFTDLWTKKDFIKWSQYNVPFLEILIYILMFKNRFFKWWQKRVSTRNVDIYRDMDKNDLSRNVVFVEMLIFSDICTKNDFWKWAQNIVIFIEMLIFSDIHMYLFLEFWYFRIYGQKTVFESDLKII